MPATHWFEGLADHMGEAYLRYSFTKGTVREVDALLERVDLPAGSRVLDVGCGPGRHANELGRRGFEVVGVDISDTFLALARAEAPPTVTYERHDARDLPFRAEFDLVISICQGAFGLAGGPDEGVTPPTDLDPDQGILDGMARAARPRAPVLFTAFNAYLQVSHLLDGNDFDAARGVHRETTEIRDPDGVAVTTDLWTTCFTPRELRLMCVRAGLEVRSVESVEPGDWTARPPDHHSPEFLVVAAASL